MKVDGDVKVRSARFAHGGKCFDGVIDKGRGFDDARRANFGWAGLYGDKSLFFALFYCGSSLFGCATPSRAFVHFDAVTQGTAEHFIDGHVCSFSGEVPKCLFDTG